MTHDKRRSAYQEIYKTLLEFHVLKVIQAMPNDPEDLGASRAVEAVMDLVDDENERYALYDFRREG